MQIWRGVKSFTDAVDQLFSYAAWRDTELAVLMLVGEKNLSDIIDKARDALADHGQFEAWSDADNEQELRATMSLGRRRPPPRAAHRLLRPHPRPRLTPSPRTRARQNELAAAAGLSRTVYNKLERGAYRDPPLRRLGNCAIVLGVEPEQLIPPDWRQWWKPQPGDPDAPADPRALWSAR